MRACMSGICTPDLFIADPTNCDIAVAIPLVPAADCMLPPVMPPMPAIEMAVEPIMPFMIPSDASFIMAVTMPEDDVVIPMVFAYCVMAAMHIP